MKFLKSTRLTITLGVILIAATVTASEKPTRFAVIGDRTGEHQEGIYEQIVAEIARLRPDFALTVGDMIEGYTVDTAVLNREWEEYKSIVRALPCPIFYTPGNHDITYDAALETYRRHIGEPYYSFMIDSLYFIVLDNSRRESNRGFDEAQLAWLQAELEKSRAAYYTFVTHHKPFWFELTASGHPDTTHALFKKYGVDMVFTGHYHVYFSGMYDGVRYISVGSSGGDTEPGISGLGYHFLWVTVDSSGIHTAPVAFGGVLSESEVTAAEFAFAQNVERSGISFDTPLPVDPSLNLRESEAILTLHNLQQEIAADDTLRWEVPEGWTVTPSVLPVSLAPGDRSSLRFTVSRSGESLYPIPSVSIRLPVATGKSQKVKRVLQLSREAYCRRVSPPPTIDGRLDEPVWSAPVERFFSDNGSPMATDSVYFYFAYDDSSLYLAARCLESKPESLKAALSGHDAPVHSEDCVGFFFQPDLNREEVFQVYFNPVGAIFDQKITPNVSGYMTGDPAWNGIYELKTLSGPTGWTVEARIPLAQWRATAAPETAWGLNFRRKQYRLQTSANWQVPIDYDPKSFGKLLFTSLQ
ncbi:MAG: metallophosphoesterase [bacterium]|jgi:predicted phosphodiesterase